MSTSWEEVRNTCTSMLSQNSCNGHPTFTSTIWLELDGILQNLEKENFPNKLPLPFPNPVKQSYYESEITLETMGKKFCQVHHCKFSIGEDSLVLGITRIRGENLLVDANYYLIRKNGNLTSKYYAEETGWVANFFLDLWNILRADSVSNDAINDESNEIEPPKVLF